MRTTRLFMTSLLSVGLLLGGCADSEEAGELETEDGTVGEETVDVGFADYDADQDELLRGGEYDAWWEAEGVYGEWDVDADQELTREEFAEGVHGRWDRDDSGGLSEDEWREGIEVWYSEAEYGEWADWDGDGDSELDLNEIREGMEREGLYDRVDGDHDAVIDDEELADWFFDIFDVDDNQEIDTTEYDGFWGGDGS